MIKGLVFLLKMFWQSSKLYVVYNVLLQVTLVVIPLANIIFPKLIIDSLLLGNKFEVVMPLAIALITINFVCNLLVHHLQYRIVVLTNNVFMDFQETLIKKTSSADMEQLETKEYNELKENAYKFLYGDYRGFGTVLQDGFAIIGKIMIFMSVIAILLTLNPYIVIIFIFLVVISSLVDSKSKKITSEIDFKKTPYERRTMYYAKIADSYEYGKEMRIGILSDWIVGKYRSHLKETGRFYKDSRKIEKNSRHFNEVTNLIRDGVSYTYLIWLVVNSSISIGSFTMYITSVKTFSDSMREMIESITNIHRFKPYYEATSKYLDLPNEMRKTGTKKINEDKWNFEFVNVSFKYKGANSYAIRNLNLSIENGKKYAIVGENGAGKTTFVKLLTRMYDATEGQILLNGVDIKEYEYDEYMSIFSAVFQDFKLFSFTLAENVALKKVQAEDEGLIEDKLFESGFGNKLKKLADGISTSVNKDFDTSGFEPSGGEAQKIALARALYKDASVIILDEPTAALDPKAEYDMYNNFNKLTKDKTTIFISHRLSSSRFCDEIIVFKDTKILEKGSHEELINRKGEYSKLYAMQSKYYVE